MKLLDKLMLYGNTLFAAEHHIGDRYGIICGHKCSSLYQYGIVDKDDPIHVFSDLLCYGRV